MSDYQTISVSLLALAPLIGTLPQAASAQLIEAAADSPQTIITQQEHHTQIEGGVEANNNLFHRFDSFNVETGHSANFVTPSSTQAVIGQVSGGNTSYIDGTLQVSGGDADLYLINPAGILFGPNSQLSLNGGFTATTADQIEFGETWVDVATPQDYSQIEAGPSAYKFTSQAPGSIVNHGDLAVADGNAIRLIGGDVTNTGNISAPAGEITLTAVPGESLVRLGSANALLNLEIEALPDSATSLALPELLTGDSSASATVLHTNDDGTVSLTGEVILTGALDVSSESQAETGGEINVLGSSVEIHGADLYADGGAGGGFIRVGGDYQGQSTLPTATEVTFDGTARANAIAGGNGGEVILWSDGVTDFSGEISATGAAGGEGGFVETSGRSQLIVNDGAKVITSTPDGSLGTWLLDPTDLSVVAASGTAGITAGNNTPTDSTLNAAILVSALDGNNVTLQATNSLTVDAAVNASGNGAAGDLVLQAPTLNLNETIDLMAGSSLTGTATTVNVGSNGRVQNAVDAIATGGTINLSATTYADGETFIDKDVTLQGQNNTLFDGQNTTRLFNISNGTVAIDNVIVRNGNSPGTEDGGGGLLVAGTGSLALSNSLIENNSAVNGSSRFGGGIYMTGTGSSSITDSTLQGNQARAFGGGIRTHTGHQLTITNSTITNNFAGSNGAGVDRSTNGSRVLIQDTTISNNIAQNNGGGISTGIGTDDFVIERTLFENNTAANGSGGAISGLFSSLIIRDSSFLSNQTTAIGSNGGAISTSGSLVLSDSHLEGNTAVNHGGAIHLTQNATSTIQDTTLSDNNASNGSGGAIALQEQHQLTIANSTLSNNTAAVTGGGIVNSSTALRGLNIDNSTLSSNNVTGGEGGAVLSTTGASTAIAQSTVANNTAGTTGGGITTQVGGTLLIGNTIVAGNTALSANDISGNIGSTGYNLVQDRTGSSGYGLTDLANGLLPRLGTLTDNGGPTFTHALLSGSPAIDATASALGVDQRGAVANGIRDIGAYERLPASDFSFTAGTGQTATVATAYANPLEVQVVDDFGVGVDNSPVDFWVRYTGPGNPYVDFTSPTTLTTDSAGRGTISFAANTVAGNVAINARPTGLTQRSAIVTNVADVAAGIIISDGNSQTTTVDTSFGSRVVAQVVDRFGNGIDNARINFSVPAVGASGSLSTPFDIAGPSGEGRVNVTANTVAGPFSLSAESQGFSTTATLTNQADAGAVLSIFGGNNQQAVVNNAYSDNLAVQVHDRFGNPVAGEFINFTALGTGANGNVGTPTSITDLNGVAQTSLQANTVSGTYTVRADSNIPFGASTLAALFSAENLADSAQNLFISNLSPTTMTAGDSTMFTVTARDRFGNTATDYAGTLSFNTTDLQAQLPATGLLTNGTQQFSGEFRTAGTHTLTVSDTIDLALSASQNGIGVTPAAPSSLQIITGDGQSTVVDTAFADDFTVAVRDRFNNPIIGETVSFVAPASGAGATLSNPSVVLNNIGQATTTLSANTQPGSYLVNAVVAGLSEAITLNNTVSNTAIENNSAPPSTEPGSTETGITESSILSGPVVPLLDNDDSESEDRNNLFDEYAFSQLEQALSEEYARYWQRPLKKGATLENVQQILQQAEDEYQSRSAVVYAVFIPPQNTTEDTVEDTDAAYSSLLSRRLLADDTNNAQDELLLLLIPPEGNPVQQRVAVNRRQLQRQAQLFSIELSSFLDDGYQPLAQQLYSWLLAPIEDDIQSAGIDDLMYVLDEGLSTVPLAAMMTDETYAIERYGLSVLPSIGLLETDFGEAPAEQTVIAGGSDTFTELEALPAVPVELGIVESMATSSQVLLNETFSIDNLQQAQVRSPKSIMHVATHAAFNPGATDRSYIQFWEEQLKLEDIADLELEDLELLILSACTTALGSRDAELGFAGLAAATGVEASIGSLWNVSDLGTMALMAEFYGQLQNNPLRAIALQQAQLSMLNGNTHVEKNRLITQNSSVPIPSTLVEQDIDFRHPFFWSGFTLVGNPWW